MAAYTESDATYCSEAEKEDHLQIRRSKRLSQRNFRTSFRSNGDPIQRLHEIHQILKSEDLNPKWSIHDWETLNIEVKFIQKLLKGKQKGKINFILNKINKNIKNKTSSCVNEVPSDQIIIESNQNNEQVKSPNILAGMMSEVLTEIPPYQSKSLPTINNPIISSEPTIGLTQKSPLDLTKTSVDKSHVPQVSLNISQQQNQQPNKPVTPKRATTSKETESKAMSISKDSMIDLTEELHSEQQNHATKEQTFRHKNSPHVSKWLKFLPTQQRPTFTEKPKIVIPTPVIAPKKIPKPLKNNAEKLSRDDYIVSKTISNILQKNLTHGFATQAKYFQKQNCPPVVASRGQCDLDPKKKPLRNTENIMQQNRSIHQIDPRNAQSENIRPNSPDFLLNQFLELSTSDMNDSGTSLTLSLKEDLKKVFGTDKLKDVFGEDEVIYNLNDNHLRRLARQLKVEYRILKKAVENVLANEYFGAFEDEHIQSTDSSIVECSQSPPNRLFRSQRSQSESQS